MDAKLIGKRIKTVRKQRGLTQEQLSQMVDISTNYLSNIETGFRTPKLETLIQIMNALECDANALLADVVDASTSEESGRISKELAELPAEEQRRIMLLVETLIKDAKRR